MLTMINKRTTLNTVGIVANASLERSGVAVMKRVLKFLEKKGVKILFNKHAAKALGKYHAPSRASSLTIKATRSSALMDQCDLIVTFGGDGTLIKLARHTTLRAVPILAVNLGHVGFLTEVQQAEKVQEDLERVWAKKYQLDVRMMLRITIYRKGKKVETYLTLNEAVVNQGNFARLIELNLEMNQRRMVRFKADGVVVASPTGSTGHSLSAGGPIVHPKLDAYVITPICPSGLAMRPIVLPSNRQLTLSIETRRRDNENQVALTLDGQVVTPLEFGDKIKIRRSSRHFVLIRMTNTRYYKMLRDKLHWGH